MPFQQLLNAPTSPLFQGLQGPGKFLFLIIYWNEWSSSLDTEVLEYWEYHIYIYVPHAAQDWHQARPSCILRNQKAYGQDCSLDGWEQAARLLMFCV